MNQNIFEIKLSNYLSSIEDIKGSTHAEKKKRIQCISNDIAAKYITTYVDIDELKKDIIEKVPNNFLPLVFCKVCNILKNINGIKESLLSNNKYVFQNALKATWFFDGSNRSLITPEYYKQELFKFISVKNRFQIIKNLSLCLRNSDTKLGEDLYEYISSAYDKKQALYLLPVCSSSFIITELHKDFFVIPISLLETITKIYPIVFVVYMKLLKPRISEFRPLMPILKILLSNNVNDFIDIVNMIYSSSCYLELSKKQLKAIITINIDDIIKNPYRYIEFIPKDFLKYNDKQLCLSILRSAYLEVCEKDPFTISDLINVKALQFLDYDERIRITKQKFNTNLDWFSEYQINYENQWLVCCLSSEESILLIKEQISKCSTPNDRFLCWILLLKTCDVNNDTKSFASCLNFIISRYKNDQSLLLFNFLCKTLKSTIIDNSCWFEIDNFVKILYAKNTFHDVSNPDDIDFWKNFSSKRIEIKDIQIMFENILELKLHDGCDISETMTMYSRILFDKSCFFLKVFPFKYIKFCLTKAFDCIEIEFNVNSKINESAKLSLIYNIVKYIEKFNKSVKKDKTNKLYLKDFPWLYKICHKIYEHDDFKDEKCYKYLIQKLYKEFPNIMNKQILSKIIKCNRNFIETLCVLKNNRQLIIDDIDTLVDVLGNFKSINKSIFYFLRCCKWYDDISKLIFYKLLLKLHEEDANYNYFLCLALLCDDSDLKDIVNNIGLINENDLNEEEKRNSLKLHIYTLRTLTNCDDLLPIQNFENICFSKNFINIVRYLQSITLRYSLEETKQLAEKMLKNDKISIKRHGLILFYNLASIDEILVLNKKLISSQTNRSIRKYLFESMLRLFIIKNTENIWVVIKEIFDSLKFEDLVWDVFVDVEKIPIRFQNEYILLYLRAIERVKNENKNKFDDTATHLTRKIFNFFAKNDIKISDELNSFIFETYFLPDRFSGINDFINYLIRHYICSSKDLEQRLEKVINVLSKKDLNKNHNENLEFIQYMLEDLIFNIYIIPQDKLNIIIEHFINLYNCKVPLGRYPKYSIIIELFKNFTSKTTPLQLSILIKIGLPNLVKLFGRCSIPFIGKFYQKLLLLKLYNRKPYEIFKNDLIEIMKSLLDVDCLDIGLFVAIIIQDYSIKSLNESCCEIIKKLRSFKDQTIDMYLNMLENSFLKESTKIDFF